MATDFEAYLTSICALPYAERRKVIKAQQPKYKRFIYKYRPLNFDDVKSVKKAKDILVDSKLWLSSPSDFNDPFDMAAKVRVNGDVSIIRKYIGETLKAKGLKYSQREKKIKELMSENPTALEGRLQASLVNQMEHTGVFSFAGDPRSILMWSHYASNHAGICFQFEVARDFRTFSKAINVQYSNNYPIIDWPELFHDGIGKTLITKHIGWLYEDESRIIMPGNAWKYLPFDGNAITGIILGCNFDVDKLDMIRDFNVAREKKGLSKVKIYFARKHDSQFRLSIFKD